MNRQLGGSFLLKCGLERSPHDLACARSALERGFVRRIIRPLRSCWRVLSTRGLHQHLTPNAGRRLFDVLGSGGNHMKLLYIFAIVSFALATMAGSAPVSAHPGGLNGEGCHNNRKTGDYHCHRGSSARSSPKRSFAAASGGAYHNCSAARAAGAAPVRRGDPGYGAHLDRDKDGVGCE